jgi:hypothetical protein
MPNWCECELTVTGHAANVKSFVDGIQSTTDGNKEWLNILKSYVPTPATLRDIESGSAMTGYDILYTAKWTEISRYPWIVAAHGGRPTDRETTWSAYVKTRGTEADLKALADRYQSNVTRYGVPTWYEWAQKHWGSKWGDCETQLTHHEQGTARFEFESPWRPPLVGIKAISAIFPHLRFTLEYWEGGMGFRGLTILQAGETLEEESFEYSGPRGG